MARHDFKEYGFDQSALAMVGGKLRLTCTHVLKCIKCDLVLGDTDNPNERITCDDYRENMDDCPGKILKMKVIEKPKEPWKSPIKSRTVASEEDIKTKDYPAKKAGNIAKKRRK